MPSISIGSNSPCSTTLANPTIAVASRKCPAFISSACNGCQADLIFPIRSWRRCSSIGRSHRGAKNDLIVRRPLWCTASISEDSAPARSQVVGMPGLQAGPLGDGAPIDTVVVFALRPPRPAGRRVLPPLPPPIDGQVEQPIAVVHRLDAAPRRPVSLEHSRSLSQVANNVHHAHPASNQESVER